MKNDEKTTYKVRLLCRNCNTDWEFEVAKGTYVRSEKDNNYMIKREEKKKKYFNCPKCGANKKIARLPLV